MTRMRRALVIASVGLGFGAGLPAAARAESTVDLLTAGNVRIDGAAGELSGASIDNAGDVNGDGRDDLIIGASRADRNGRNESGSAYVVYGTGTATAIDLASLGSGQGFRIDGADPDHQMPRAAAGAGDVNDDGFGDVIVSAYQASNNDRLESGSSYVVYGAASSSNVDLRSFATDTTRGFRIDGAKLDDESGFSVGAVGDVNSDGHDDVMVGAPEADRSFPGGQGSVYVVYGAASSSNVDLLSFDTATTRGFRIDGTVFSAPFSDPRASDSYEDELGWSVDNAGDVNGDGRDDLVIGAPDGAHFGFARSGAGAAYVVYGSASGANVDLETFDTDNTRGYRIDGSTRGEKIGLAVAGAGDVNDDGRNDVIIGSFFAGPNGRAQSGRSWVVYGTTSSANLDLASLDTDTTRGFRIDGAAAGDFSGLLVGAAGDVDDDGHDDVIVGAPAAGNNGRNFSGSSYVLYGATSASHVDLDSLSATRGFRVDGARENDALGATSTGVGDVNGDGRDDLLVGASSDNNGRDGSGSSYYVSILDTGIHTKPAASSDSTSASFTFSSPLAGATFACKLDDGDFAACTSQKDYSDLADGSHTFQVRAVDTDGNKGTPASYTWTVATADTTAPAATIDTKPAALSSSASASFTFSSPDADATGFECKLDGGDFAACTSPKDYTALADGSHTFQVRAKDAAGNTGEAASYTWAVDTTAPGATIDTKPKALSNDASPSFAFSSLDAGATFECKLDGGDFAACTSPKSYSALADGSHTFKVRAVDAAGNTGTAESSTWTVDATAPGAQIDAKPAALSKSASASFGFSSSATDATGFECKLDTGDFAACTSPKDYSGLADGSHTFKVRATDAAGNTGTEASYTWTVDTTAPGATIDTKPKALSNDASPSFAVSSLDASATFECMLDTGDFAACTSPKDYSGLADGSHTFKVRATDAAGNTGSAASYTWTVDTTAPNATIHSKPAALSKSASASFAFSSPDSGATFECKLDAGDFAGCMSPRSYSALAEGSHTFLVRATDAAGNTGSAASYTWTVDTTGPALAPVVNSGQPVLLGQLGASIVPGASDTNGIASSSCTPSLADAASTGIKTASCTATDNAGNTTTVAAPYLVQYRLTAFSSLVPGSRFKAGQAVPVMLMLTNVNGAPIADREAAALAAAGRVRFSVSGAQTLSPQPMRYFAADRFIYIWKLARRGAGTVTITATVTYPGTLLTSARSQEITITTR